MSAREFLDGVGADREGERSVATDGGGNAVVRVRVWDLPVRAFHWSLVLAVTVAIVTGEAGGDWMDIHGKAGLCILGLLVFRLLWGLLGSTHARFISFFPTPRRVRAYLGGRWTGAGHNPLGALSVFALLALLSVQVVSGLFSNDEIAYSGPLYPWVSEALAGRLSAIHRLSVNGLFVLIGLHVLAIGYYVRVKRDNLLKPMVTGWKDVAHGVPASRVSRLALASSVLLAVATALTIGAAPPPARSTAAPASAVVVKPAW